MSERRYDDEEVSAIFREAAEAPEGASPALPATHGMTLGELQAIGREAGLAPEAIARAAQRLDLRGTTAGRSFLGFQLSVQRTIPLGRKLTDEEWDRVVVALRETFEARGQVRADGSLRQWTNGNLQALLEPTATGHRLRLRTMNGGARAYMTAGLGLLGIAGVLAVVSAGSGVLAAAGEQIGVLSLIGGVMLALGAGRLPRWARTRRQQMEELAARLALPSEVGP